MWNFWIVWSRPVEDHRVDSIQVGCPIAGLEEWSLECLLHYRFRWDGDLWHSVSDAELRVGELNDNH